MSEPRFLTVARVVRAHGVKGELSCEIVTEFPERFRKTTRVYLVPDPGRPAGRGKPKPMRARRTPAPSSPPAPAAGGGHSARSAGARDTHSAVATPPAVSSVRAAIDGESRIGPPTTPESDSAGSAAPTAGEYAVSRARVVPHARGAQLVLQLVGLDDRDAADALRGWLVQVPENEAWKLPKGRYYWHQIIGLAVVTADGRRLGTVSDILETGANDVYVVAREGDDLLLPAIKDVVKRIAPERGEMVVELLPGME